MRCNSISVKTPEKTEAKLYTYFPENFPEIDMQRKRPVVVICPGGGYEFTSDREAEAVALRFTAMGYHACVLRYSVAPAEFPQALCELAWCVAYLRRNAEEYGIVRDKIIVSGFSAGGHLAASLGVFWNASWLKEAAALTNEEMRPNGLVLSYPVITSGCFAHGSSFDFLMGKKAGTELKEYLSLEKQVGKDTPPAFIWHTAMDKTVPVQNSMLFAGALIENQISVELHVFPEGDHGLSLADRETQIAENGFGVQPECQIWIQMAGRWIANLH